MSDKTILNRYEILKKEIAAIQKELSELPEGTLICSHNKGYINWYITDGHHKTYLPKSKRSVAEKLAVKKYLSIKLEELKQEKSALELFANYQSVYSSQTERFLADHPEIQELLSPYFQSKYPEFADWSQAPYIKNTKYPENLIHKTSSGIYVRSKSESIIAHTLFTNQIPFRYECILKLGSVTLFPDFTILHPQTQKQYYWEHFGKMDDTNYTRNVSSKIQLYLSHQIIPSIDLITTYETAKHPFTHYDAQKIVEQYFL